jgi:hypothetical protein
MVQPQLSELTEPWRVAAVRQLKTSKNSACPVSVQIVQAVQLLTWSPPEPESKDSSRKLLGTFCSMRSTLGRLDLAREAFFLH